MIIDYIIFSLAWIFGSFLTLIPISIPILAQSFLRVQGVCLPDTGYVLSYIEDVRTGKNNTVIVKKNRQNTTQGSIIHQIKLNMQNEPNLDIFLTFN